MDSALWVLIPISVLLVLGIVGVLWWAVRSGQFDDLEGPAHAILMDDDRPAAPASSTAPARPAISTDTAATPPRENP